MSNPIAVINEVRAELTGPKFMSEVRTALPPHVDPQKFMRVAMTSISTNPRLLECNRRSLFSACMSAAQLGLMTDGILGEAYLVPRRQGGEMMAVMVPGYRGLLKLARQSGDLASVDVDVIYDTDKVAWTGGDDAALRVERPFGAEPGKVVGAYAVATFKDGSKQRAVMTAAQIERVRDQSDGWAAYKAGRIKNTPWAAHFEEMAKKTVFRRLAKMLPLSTEAQAALALADADERGAVAQVAPGGEVIEAPAAPAPDAAPAPAAKRGRPRKLDAVAQANSAEQPVSEPQTDGDNDGQQIEGDALDIPPDLDRRPQAAGSDLL